MLVSLMAAICSYEEENFDLLTCVPRMKFVYSYLRDVTRYGIFLRCCLVRWLFGNSTDVTAFLNELKQRNTANNQFPLKSKEIPISRKTSKDVSPKAEPSIVDFTIQTNVDNSKEKSDFEYNMPSEKFQSLNGVQMRDL